MPPEFINEGRISPKNDVFSFGVVMIEIMTRPAAYSNSFEMGDVAQLSQQVRKYIFRFRTRVHISNHHIMNMFGVYNLCILIGQVKSS